uniref:V-type proton ATPase subunit H n=1 Tax=Agrotis ipsilon TaxID=56364 RepID=A0A0D3L6K9_AGRIP|nr:vacuolar ATP synthase subunit H [Agrotis ipsilon]
MGDENVNQVLPSLGDGKIDMIAATSALQIRASDIRTITINWSSYLQSQMITQRDHDFMVLLDREGTKSIPDRTPELCGDVFLSLLTHISKDQTIQYLLVKIDDILSEDKNRARIFRDKKNFQPFLNLLNRHDEFIQHMAARIIAKLAVWHEEPMDKGDLHFYLSWLIDQLKMNNNEYIQSVARCLQMMLRVDAYRFAFLSVDGISTLLTILASRVNFQVQYQLVFCLWVLTFNPLLAEKMNKFNAIPILADILSDSVKEKVTRIVLAVFRNLIEKPEDPQVSKEHCIAMVQCKVLKQLSILEQKRSDDEDIMNDVDYLNERLQTSVQDLSSFDKYATEVKSGRLEWSPVHKSAKFWRENAARLNERGQELLRTLVHLLQFNTDPVVLAVACYDIGEYVRHYPRGKHIIEQLGGKQHVMHLLSHADPNVRYEALLAVQKLMVHNWEYLGKQLEKEQIDKQAGTVVGAKA